MPRRSANRASAVRDAVAARITAERQAAGWALADLVEAMASVGCPMHASAIWRIEKGDPPREVRVDEAIAFAAVFGITLDALLFGSFDPVDAARRRCDRIMAASGVDA